MTQFTEKFTPQVPGVALCAAVAAVAYGAQAAEQYFFGRAALEALVLAILAGALVRSLWTPSARWRPGVRFSGKFLLELAVMLLGASLSAGALAAAGPTLLGGVALVVAASLAASYGIARLLRLPHKMALLVACGNSICGNSAIAAVASVIEADGEEVAASISFTAILGVIAVVALPGLVPLLHLSFGQYGVLAGLTVYAVPQVLAATVPVAALSVQIGTLVKLLRVLTLGPVLFGVSLLQNALGRRNASAGAPARPSLKRLAPWFILGFLALAALRSIGLIPEAALPLIERVAAILTVLSMAALGLDVDLGSLRRVGGRATIAVTLSLLALIAISYALIRLIGTA
jgi:uncharacterized integral membrane protein (TIGR00698 family)